MLTKDEDGLKSHYLAQKPRKARPFDVLIITVLPWLIFSLTAAIFAFGYEDYAALVWILTAACLSISILFLAVGILARRSVQLALGLLCSAALCIAVATGLTISDSFMEEYFRLEDGQFYDNMRADAAGSDFQDASSMIFSDGSHLDAGRSVGYMQAGTVYCAAPVEGSVPSSNPQIWAVGMNCCEERGGFHCNAAEDPEALSAVTISRDDDDYSEYLDAIRMSRKIFDLDSTETGDADILVKWIGQSPEEYRQGLWRSAWTTLAVASAIDLVMCIIAGYLLSNILKARV